MRERVAPLECKPPQGRYEGPSLRVFLHTATPHCTIIFTLDGTEPIESSDRDQGYRCEHYHPKGFELRGGGRHTLTVVALRRGLVSTKPTTFTFTLDGPPHQRKLHGTERNLHTAFQLASRQSAGGGRISPLDICVLRDISSKSDLRHTIQTSGAEHVKVFKLKYRSHEVSRSIAFERVATPSIRMTMPMLPNAVPSMLARSESLRNSAVRCMTPARYDTPQCFSPTHERGLIAYSRAGTPSLHDASVGSRPQSPSAVFGGSFTIHDDRARSILPRIRPDHHPERPKQQSSVNTDLSLFELKQGLSHIRVDEGAVQESADRLEEDQYHATCEAVIEREIQRKSGISKMFARVAKERLPTNVQHTDIAEVDNEPLNIFVSCMQIAQSELLRTVVTTTPMATIAKELNGIHQIASADLARAFHTTPEVVQRNLKAVAVKLPDGLRYPCKVVVALLRYLVCLAEPIPEAPLYMFLLIWRISAERKSVATEGGTIGRVSLLTAIDVYRRTRGANAVAVAQLYDAYYHGLEWGREGTVSVLQLVQHFADHVPHVDAAISWMSDAEHPMYKRTVSVSSL